MAKDKDIRKMEKKQLKREKSKTNARCSYDVVDPCGCYVDSCGCYVDPCGC